MQSASWRLMKMAMKSRFWCTLDPTTQSAWQLGTWSSLTGTMRLELFWVASRRRTAWRLLVAGAWTIFGEFSIRRAPGGGVEAPSEFFESGSGRGRKPDTFKIIFCRCHQRRHRSRPLARDDPFPQRERYELGGCIPGSTARLVALRVGNWKAVFMEQRCEGTLRIWAEPFTTLRVPKIYNLRTDPYERADTTS